MIFNIYNVIPAELKQTKWYLPNIIYLYKFVNYIEKVLDKVQVLRIFNIDKLFLLNQLIGQVAFGEKTWSGEIWLVPNQQSGKLISYGS